jgi:hypothetical protein
MRRPASEPPFTCPTCEAATGPRPVFHLGLPFCCAGCVAGGPCLCSYDHEDDDAPLHADRPSAAAHDLGRLVGAAR